MKLNGTPESMAELKEILNPMTGKERIAYLWEYYKIVPIIIVSVIVFVVLIFAPGPERKSVFEGTCINIILPEQGEAYLTEEWLQVMGGNAETEQAPCINLYIGDLTTNTDVDAVTLAQKPVLMTAARELDYALMDESSMQVYLLQGLFCSLETILSQEQLQQFGEDLIYCEDEDGARFPVAVDLSDTAFGKACLSADGKVFIAFTGCTDRVELSDDFLTHILNWEPKE